MKYVKTCASCGRRASRRFRGVNLCNDCLKYVRRKPRPKYVIKEVHVATLGQGCSIYQCVPVKFK